MAAVTKFGSYRRGKSGPRGPPGRDALDIYTWLPECTVRMMRESEDCTYYFDHETDGVVVNKSTKEIALYDHFGRNHAVCIQNFQRPVRLGKLGIYGLPIRDSKFKISYLKTQASMDGTIFLVAFTFKILEKLVGEEPRYIFVNQDDSRGVTIDEKHLNILGSSVPLQLEYIPHDWNSVLIQWSKGMGNRCLYYLNGKIDYFTLKIDHNDDD